MTRLPCPRCERDVAVRNQRPVRHKGTDGSWCSGEPKGIYELVGDILDSTADQRTILSTVVDAYIAFGEALLAASQAHTEAQVRTSVLVKRATELLDELTKKRKTAA